mmetsp:Transcript_42873/g.38098  ORF Transcript_42873/g.38098 Transcript_42873/m.38098 type:complete len:291 (-) Transcript_42873:630-1502(-)|eukprot:CAMPEP_0201577612 /NCGR_PEP_ID=MMETSP0190_2-20130828/24072_1 /ASSEMBLY_ACC=CAM_ASM_000263 /TAXON_ID=37353 /ORGANISM="Rosalina sp." /LENGTH=290 /DNA_ID=CAMNT_0048009821 /DNA_START=14 /DNA_END=886 /DNA_ORIENTATION=+
MAEMAQTLKTIVVAGATGGVGRHCINILVRDPRVGSVIALTRGNAKDPDYYGLEEKSDDLDKLQHLQVDYNGDLNEQFGDLKFDAGMSGLGVYTADVKDEADFRKKEYEPNLKVATAAAQHGASRWAYLSGAGVKQTDSKSWHQPLFSWIKGCIEKDLVKVTGLDFVSSVRPGFIAGKPNPQSGFSGFMEKMINNHFQDSILKTKMAVHRDDIATSMVYTVLNEELESPLIYENEDIKEAAKIYRDLYEKLPKPEAKEVEQDQAQEKVVEEQQTSQEQPAVNDESKNEDK